MKKSTLLLSLIAVALMGAPAVADDSYNDDLAAVVAYKTQTRDELKSRIAQIDSEMARCKKAKTGWTAATIVGGVGTVATGVGAIVQNNTIQNKKHELSHKNSELSDKQDELNHLN